jgi:hypothetical protein
VSSGSTCGDFWIAIFYANVGTNSAIRKSSLAFQQLARRVLLSCASFPTAYRAYRLPVLVTAYFSVALLSKHRATRPLGPLHNYYVSCIFCQAIMPTYSCPQLPSPNSTSYTHPRLVRRTTTHARPRSNIVYVPAESSVDMSYHTSGNDERSRIAFIPNRVTQTLDSNGSAVPRVTVKQRQEVLCKRRTPSG